MTNKPKIKVGWFSFSCCEDSTIVMTELLNDHWQEWIKVFEFRHAKVLKTNNILDHLDIAFIEGAIATSEHKKKVKEIRKKSNTLIAVGACAVIGMPSGQRNRFDKKRQQEIEFLLARFHSLRKVLKVSDVVQVDMEIPGCPMDPDKFLVAINSVIKDFYAQS